jgi:hypothetical protein
MALNVTLDTMVVALPVVFLKELISFLFNSLKISGLFIISSVEINTLFTVLSVFPIFLDFVQF